MGTCYICGKEHVDYRRTVFVGNSSRVNFSSRGRVSHSVSSYYGQRTVCAKCALNVDYKNKKQNIVGSIFLGIFLTIGIILLLFGYLNIEFLFSDNKTSIDCGWFFSILGIIIFVFSQKITNENAEKWFKNNSANYVDYIDFQREEQQKKLQELQRLEVEKQNELRRLEQQRLIEAQQKEDDIKSKIAVILKSFQERMIAEIENLNVRVKLMNKSYHLETAQDCELAIKDCEQSLKMLENYKKDINKFCNDCKKQCETLVGGKIKASEYTGGLNETQIGFINMIDRVIVQLKDAENNILKEEVKIQNTKEAP